MVPTEAGTQYPVLVIGGGPAGLAAILELGRLGLPGVLVEAQPTLGGIARTAQFDGYRFDLGGHRFFTRIREIERLWEDLLGDDLLTRPRLSRIYYNGQFYNYPLRLGEVVGKLGVVRSLRTLGSYVAALLHPQLPEDTFEKWVSNRFGRVLFETFFKSYTEKVWGLPCSEISSAWARQRIKNLSLGKAILSRLNPLAKTAAATSLIEEFRYPRLGPGMMWDACADRARAAGQQVMLAATATELRHRDGAVTSVRIRTAEGEREWPCRAVISSMALPDLVRALRPAPPAAVVRAADELRFREFVTVALVIDRTDLFPDNWIYVHEPTCQVGRIQNFRNWSPDLIPNDRETVVGLEYFCNRGDQVWSSPDSALVELASDELSGLGLLGAGQVLRGFVARVDKAYPVYQGDFATHVRTIREWLERNLSNLQTCGRNGLHRYNNLDHSMLTGLYAARNVAGEDHDIWSVNLEEAYLE
jgi:protoporphyrinogen oxidase